MPITVLDGELPDVLNERRVRNRTNGLFGDKIPLQVSDLHSEPLIGQNGSNLHLDITNDAQWSLGEANYKNSQELCSIQFRFFQPKFSSGITNIYSNINQFLSINEQNTGFSKFSDGRISNPIENLIIADEVGRMTMPFLSLNNQVYETSFGGKTEGGGAIGGIANDIKSLFINNAGFTGGFGDGKGLGFNKILGGSVFANAGSLTRDIGQLAYPSLDLINDEFYYQTSSAVSWELEMELINTDNMDKMKYHKELVEYLQYQFSANARNRYTSDSPIVFEYCIEPKLRWCPLAHCSSFSYEGHGNLRVIEGVAYPEAYTIRMTINEALPPIRTVMLNYLQFNTKNKCIQTDEKLLCATLNRALDNVNSSVDFIQSLF